MDNNKNPNKRYMNFNSQQQRAAKKRRLNLQYNTRGRGRGGKGRGAMNQNRMSMRGRGMTKRGKRMANRMSIRGRGRGRGSNNSSQQTVQTNLRNTQNTIRQSIAPNSNINTSTNPQNQPSKSVDPLKALRASALASMQSNKSTTSSTSPQKPLNPLPKHAMTAQQIENLQRKKQLQQKRKPPQMQKLKQPITTNQTQQIPIQSSIVNINNNNNNNKQSNQPTTFGSLLNNMNRYKYDPQKQTATQPFPLVNIVQSNTNTPAAIQNQQRRLLLQKHNLQKQQRQKRIQEIQQIQQIQKLNLQKQQKQNLPPTQPIKSKLNPNAAEFKVPTTTISNVNKTKNNIPSQQQNISTKGIAPRKLTSYRTLPIHKDNMSITTTTFDVNNNAVQTVITKPTMNANITKTSSSSSPKIKNLQKIPIIPNLPSLPPKIAISTPAPTSSLKKIPTAPKQQDDKTGEWPCSFCTYLNKQSESRVCIMCRQKNFKKPTTNTNMNMNKNKNVIPMQQTTTNHPTMSSTQNIQNKTIVQHFNRPQFSQPNPSQTIQQQMQKVNIAPKTKEIKLPQKQLTISSIANDTKNTQVINNSMIQNQVRCGKSAKLSVKLSPSLKRANKKNAMVKRSKIIKSFGNRDWMFNSNNNLVSFEQFINESHQFFNSMDNDLKKECKARGILYIDPKTNLQENNLAFDIVEDYKWTKAMSNKYNVKWNNFDMTAFQKAIMQCNQQ